MSRGDKQVVEVISERLEPFLHMSIHGTVPTHGWWWTRDREHLEKTVHSDHAVLGLGWKGNSLHMSSCVGCSIVGCDVSW